MGTHNTPLTLLNVKIRTDAEGRYCLNDCHRAAGGEKKDGPSYFLDTDQAKRLIEELRSTGNPVDPLSIVTTGPNDGRGTFTHRLLVYAYGEWISAKFHLAVLEAFDAMVTGRAPTSPSTPAFDPTNFINLALAHFPNLSPIRQQTMIATVAEAVFGRPVLPLPRVEEHYASASEVAAELGVTPNKIGRIANSFGLKRPEFGIVVMDKARHSAKQVEAFRYNRAGIEAIRGQISSGMR